MGWREYFDEALDIAVGDDTFRVYTAGGGAGTGTGAGTGGGAGGGGGGGPVVFCLHGCPYTALSWALVAGCCAATIVCRISRPSATRISPLLAAPHSCLPGSPSKDELTSEHLPA